MAPVSDLFSDVPGGAHIINQLVSGDDMGHHDLAHLRQFEGAAGGAAPPPAAPRLQRQPSSQGAPEDSGRE